MHHVKKIRDMKEKNSNLDFFTRQMAAINRKQVPLCQDHHVRLHNNSWTDGEREKFKSYRPKPYKDTNSPTQKS